MVQRIERLSSRYSSRWMDYFQGRDGFHSESYSIARDRAAPDPAGERVVGGREA